MVAVDMVITTIPSKSSTTASHQPRNFVALVNNNNNTQWPVVHRDDFFLFHLSTLKTAFSGLLSALSVDVGTTRPHICPSGFLYSWFDRIWHSIGLLEMLILLLHMIILSRSAGTADHAWSLKDWFIRLWLLCIGHISGKKTTINLLKDMFSEWWFVLNNTFCRSSNIGDNQRENFAFTKAVNILKRSQRGSWKLSSSFTWQKNVDFNVVLYM